MKSTAILLLLVIGVCFANEAPSAVRSAVPKGEVQLVCKQDPDIIGILFVD